jgi:hypothetical protein
VGIDIGRYRPSPRTDELHLAHPAARNKLIDEDGEIVESAQSRPRSAERSEVHFDGKGVMKTVVRDHAQLDVAAALSR